MEKSFFISTSFVIVFMMLLISNTQSHTLRWTVPALANEPTIVLPLPPDTALAQSATSAVQIEKHPLSDSQTDDALLRENRDTPVRVIIPSIKLNSAIVGVGLNTKGEMDVPSGKTNNVGWYEDGTTPGELGSAVLDAHVFAAFGRLRELKEGADVYVLEKSGRKLHFKVIYRNVYPLRDVPLNKLFLAEDAKRLNLITCAGALTRDRLTYDHRLIVYTTLVEDAGR